MATNNKEKLPKAIFFDAAGTLFYLTGTAGDHYALVASEVGLTLDAHQLDRAFYSAWKKCRAALRSSARVRMMIKVGGVSSSILFSPGSRRR
jgi:hypothetical protein